MAKLALSAVFGTCLAVLGLSSTAAWAEKKVALIIGNSAYESVGKLPNPANDATAVAKMFQDAGFEVIGRRDLGNVEFRRTIREFTFKSRGADIAVVFFAGHGIEVKGTNYLIPTDAKLVTDFDASDEAISLDRILESIDTVKRLRLVILDACRDNPFEKKIIRNSSTRAVARGLAEVGIGAGNMLVAYAAKAGSTADDGSGEHSPFTSALLKHLAVPGLDVRIAMGRVRDEVLQNTNNRQEPFTYGSLGGSELFIIPPPAKPKIEEAPLPGLNQNAEVRRDYELAMQLGSKEAWEAFLTQHPNGGLYTTFAKQQVAKLNAPVVAIPAEPAQAGQENLTWERIRKSDDSAVFRDFIQRFPNGPRALEARRRLELLEAAARQREERLRAEDRRKQTIEDGKRQKREADQRKQDETRREKEAAEQRKQEELRKQPGEAKAKSTESDVVSPGQAKDPVPAVQQEAALPSQDKPAAEPKPKPERAAPRREKKTASRGPAKQPVEARRSAPRSKPSVARPSPRGGRGGGGGGGGGGGSGMIGI